MNEDFFLSNESADTGSIRQIRTDCFAAAFNAKNYDIICALIAPQSRRRILKSIWLGCDKDDLRQFFDALYQLNGKLHFGRVRTDQGTLQNVLCWENRHYIRLLFDREDRVAAIDFQPQDKSAEYELIMLDEAPVEHPLNAYPELVDIGFLPPSEGMRFCLRARFNNGEEKLCRLDCRGEADEIALIGSCCFTDRIFRSGRIVAADPGTRKYRPGAMPPCGQRVEFINGFFISAAELYFDGIRTE